jgi:hypothetical protein
MRRWQLFLGLTLVVMLLGGCGTARVEEVDKVVEQPEKFVNKTVTVRGKVTNVRESPQGDAVWEYDLQGKSEAIPVRTAASKKPEPGIVSVTGVVLSESGMLWLKEQSAGIAVTTIALAGGLGVLGLLAVVLGIRLMSAKPAALQAPCANPQCSHFARPGSQLCDRCEFCEKCGSPKFFGQTCSLCGPESPVPPTPPPVEKEECDIHGILKDGNGQCPKCAEGTTAVYAWLETVEGPRVIGPVPLGPRVLRIGRDPSRRESDDWVVLRDETVSADHASVRRDDGHFYLRDLDSKNGTFVNGQRLDGRHELQSGDKIHIGRTTFVFKLHGE